MCCALGAAVCQDLGVARCLEPGVAVCHAWVVAAQIPRVGGCYGSIVAQESQNL